MEAKLKVRFLTVIWGARYVEEFARISLPSYLAAGNLPFVASETTLEIIILTSSESLAKFDELPIFRKLKSLCPVRFILIDDLITAGNYGVTLTLAYARGIIDSGAEQTNTTFVFMNSDFVLADGSLRTLVGMLRKQHRCIMAPSLRASAETTLPLLTTAVDSVDHTLTMEPRRMVKLAFDHLHPTVIGKTITQDLVTCATHNQIYWQVDGATLLGRYHLIFMLAIQPEVPMGPVNSYCDYGFVPELVPSGEFAVMDDSDTFFMLELQPAAQERNFLRCGTKSLADMAAELSRWTTREHRRFAAVDVVFRSGEPTAALAPMRGEAEKFVTNLHSRMSRKPKDHVDHYYWVSGLQAWASLKFPGETPVLPPEITAAPRRRPSARPNWRLLHLLRRSRGTPRPRSRLARSYIDLLGLMRRVADVIPNVPVWHHLWPDSRLILNWLECVKRHPGKRCLLICDEASPLPLSLAKHTALDTQIGFDEASIVPAAGMQDHPFPVATSSPDNQRYDNILIHVPRAELRRLRGLLQLARDRGAPAGTISVYIEHKDAELDASNFKYELAQYAEDLLPPDWLAYHVETAFTGGRIKRHLRLMERRLQRHLWPASPWRLPYLFAALLLWPFTAALTTLNNLRLRNPSATCPDYCSGALLSLTRTSVAEKTTPMELETR